MAEPQRRAPARVPRPGSSVSPRLSRSSQAARSCAPCSSTASSTPCRPQAAEVTAVLTAPDATTVTGRRHHRREGGRRLVGLARQGGARHRRLAPAPAGRTYQIWYSRRPAARPRRPASCPRASAAPWCWRATSPARAASASPSSRRAGRPRRRRPRSSPWRSDQARATVTGTACTAALPESGSIRVESVMSLTLAPPSAAARRHPVGVPALVVAVAVRHADDAAA